MDENEYILNRFIQFNKAKEYYRNNTEDLYLGMRSDSRRELHDLQDILRRDAESLGFDLCELEESFMHEWQEWSEYWGKWSW